MLSQLNSSSKRLHKIKKHRETHQNDFQFLLRSMDHREESKENHHQNMLTYSTTYQPKQSIQKLQKEMLSKSINFQTGGQNIQSNQINFQKNNKSKGEQNHTKEAKFFFENVKNLESSNVSLRENERNIDLRGNERNIDLRGNERNIDPRYTKNSNHKDQQNQWKAKEEKTPCVLKNGNKTSSKNSSKMKTNKSNKEVDSLWKQLKQKIKQSMKASSDLVEEIISQESEQSYSKKIKKMRRSELELIQILNRMQSKTQRASGSVYEKYNNTLEQKPSSHMIKSVKTTMFQITPIQTLENHLENNQKGTHNNQKETENNHSNSHSSSYLKIIEDLEQERCKLNNLISQHELTNIKMFIKINQNQNQEIQSCKHQLAKLFHKYQKLEKIVLAHNQKMIEMTQTKQKDDQFKLLLRAENQEIRKIIDQYQNHLQKIKLQNQQIRQQLDYQKNNRMVLVEGHSRQASEYVAGNTLGQVTSFKHDRIKSNFDMKNNNHCAPRLSIEHLYGSEEEELASSIGTVTTRMKKHQKQMMGINFGAVSREQPKDDLNLKQQKYISKMECVIDEQNKALEQACTQLQNTIQTKDAEIQELEEKLKQKERHSKKGAKECQLLNAKNLKYHCNQQNLKQSFNASSQHSKSIIASQHSNQTSAQKSQKKKEKVVAVNQEENKFTKVYQYFENCTNSSKKIDQYRIIAMQAEAIQQMLKANHKIR